MKEKRKKEKRLPMFSEKNMVRDILRFALPVAGSGLFQQAYALFHAAVVSRSLSIVAISVLGACGAFVSMQSFVANGMTTGFGIYLSRCFGQEDEEQYQKNFTASLLLTAFLFLLSVLFVFFIDFFMKIARIPQTLWIDCRSYLCMLMLGTGFMGFRNLMVCVLQGMGDSGFPGFITAAGVVSQTLLLLAAVRLNLGIIGPPLAVLFNNALLGGVLFFYMRKKYGNYAVFASKRKIPKTAFFELFSNGCSKSGMMILVGIGGFFMQRAQNGLSEEILAGSSLADTLSNFFLVPISALAQTASVAAGQNMGRKKYKTIRSYNRKLFAGHVACGAVICLISMFAGTFFLELMAGPVVSAEVIAAGRQWLTICIPGFFGLGTAMICRNSLQAMGCYEKLICLGALEMTVTIAFALFGVPNIGYPAYCASILVKWTALGVFAGYWYRKKLLFFQSDEK